MENDVIALLVEYPNSDCKRCKRYNRCVSKQLRAEHIAVKNALPKHFNHWIKRIDFNKDSCPMACNSLERIYDRNHIEKKLGKNVPNVFNISEIYADNRKNKPYSRAENKQKEHRHNTHKHIRRDMKIWTAANACKLKEYPYADKAEKRYRKRNEIWKNRRKRIHIFRNIYLFDNACVSPKRGHSLLCWRSKEAE